MTDAVNHPVHYTAFGDGPATWAVRLACCGVVVLICDGCLRAILSYPYSVHCGGCGRHFPTGRASVVCYEAL